MKAKRKTKKRAKAKKTSSKLILKKEDQFGVILEDINSKFDYLAEGYDILKKGQSDLNTKIDGVNKNLNAKIDGVNKSLNAKIDGVSESLNTKIDRNHKEFTEFRVEANSKFDTILKQLFNIDDELQFMKSEIMELRMEFKKKADLDRLEALEKRVTRLEANNVKLRALATQSKS